MLVLVAERLRRGFDLCSRADRARWVIWREERSHGRTKSELSGKGWSFAEAPSVQRAEGEFNQKTRKHKDNCNLRYSLENNRETSAVLGDQSHRKQAKYFSDYLCKVILLNY